MGLIDKSNNNKICKTWACSHGYFDIATSRLYYSLYQKLIQLDSELGLGIKTSNHETFIQSISIALRNQSLLSNGEKTILLRMQGIRKLRNRADYKPNMVNATDFNLIENSAYKIESILDKLLA